MGVVLNKLNKDQSQSFTLTPEDIQFLQDFHMKMQARLDAIQQECAATILHHIAVTRFGYAPNCDLTFNLDMGKEKDNLEIINIAK
jgi:hypothetical protein